MLVVAQADYIVLSELLLVCELYAIHSREHTGLVELQPGIYNITTDAFPTTSLDGVRAGKQPSSRTVGLGTMFT